MLLNTPAYQVGQQAPAFTLSDPDGNAYSLESLMGEKGLLVAFICNHCPYVQAVIDRFVADAKLLQADGVNVVAVMSNDYRYVSADSPVNMKKFAQQHGFIPIGNEDEHKKERVVALKGSLQQGIQNEIKGR